VALYHASLGCQALGHMLCNLLDIAPHCGRAWDDDIRERHITAHDSFLTACFYDAKAARLER
jgi:hypothetical protein